MSGTDVGVRPASRTDRQAIVALLARAFADDPVIRWFMPEREGRPDRLDRFFHAALTRDVLPNGEVQVAERGGTFLGAALWRRPGAWQTTGWRQLADLPFWLWVFGRGAGRAATGLDTLKASHPHALHWYLPTIGVEPSAQGQGVGGALLKAMLQRCDAERIPAYLESSKPSNVAFYERHGFRVMGEQRLPDGPLFWPMWRDPHPVA